MRSSSARIIAIVGLALAVAALAANQSFLDRHFLPSFFLPRAWYVAIESTVRLAIAGAGLGLVGARARIARLLTRAPATTVQVIAAALLAVAASELAVRQIRLRPTEWLLTDEEPRRQDDPTLGWVLVPGRVGHARVGGRPIDYAIDASGCRVSSLGEPVDPDRTAIVFAGESVMFGEGLTWEESIPARVGALLGVHTANLAVHGYGTDQIYLRLARELPRFRRPTAVVSIFMTELFGRNLDDDRPHLAPGLRWRPAEHPSRLMALAGLLVPYRREATVDQGVEVTRDALRAIVQLARRRGAAPLVLVPHFGADTAVQQKLRQRIFADDIPALDVPLDPGWRLRWDRHPNADAARVIATAIAARLRPGRPEDH